MNQNNENNKNNKSSRQTKVFRNLLYGLAIVITFSSLIKSVQACTCGDKKNKWSYEEFMRTGFKAIFDKMGFICRVFGIKCYGEEYSKLNTKEQKAIDEWSMHGKYGKYFPFLPKNSIELFCQFKEPYEENKCDILNIVRCNFPNEIIKYCGEKTIDFLTKCYFETNCSIGLK